MSLHISRKQFLHGDFKGNEAPLRPPWAVNESMFTEICNRCSNCITHCPNQIIKQSEAGYPVIDFTFGECSFCEICLDICEPHALLKTGNTNEPWLIKIAIKQNTCIAFNGVECRSCYDPCEIRAITMPPRLGGISIPVINTDICSGCGACYSVCPVHAITVS